MHVTPRTFSAWFDITGWRNVTAVNIDTGKIAWQAKTDQPMIAGALATAGNCHGPGGNSTNGSFPTLAGQTKRYPYLQLRDFGEGRRKDR